MPFEIILTEKAKKCFKELDKHIASRIADKLAELAKKETVSLEKLEGKNFYKFRVGDYRVLIEKFPATKKLIVLKVGHRKNIYKNI